MNKIYKAYGGINEFTDSALILTKNLIQHLQFEIEMKLLPDKSSTKNQGSSSEYYYEQDLKFCKDVLNELNKGNLVIYYPN